MAKELSVTLKKSPIGKIGKHKSIIRGLGLKRPNQSVVLKDTPQIRGMVNKISYLVDVKEIV